MKKILWALVGAAWLGMVPGTGKAFEPIELTLQLRAHPCRAVERYLDARNECPSDAECIGFSVTLSPIRGANCILSGGTDEVPVGITRGKIKTITGENPPQDLADSNVVIWPVGSDDPSSIRIGMIIRDADAFTSYSNLIFSYEVPPGSDGEKIMYFTDVTYNGPDFISSSAGSDDVGVPPPPIEDDVAVPPLPVENGSVCFCGVAEPDAERCEDFDVAECERLRADLGLPSTTAITSGVDFRGFPEDESDDQRAGGGRGCQLNPLAVPQGFSLAWLVLAGFVWLRVRKK